MKIFYGLEQFQKIPNPVLTIGTFDGVHLGHQKIIANLNQTAKEIGGESVLFTFDPHPRTVLNPYNDNIQLIQTQEEKLKKLNQIGLQNCIVFPFSKEFSQLTANEFFKNYLIDKINIKHLIIGYDHQFGKNREGGIEFLQQIKNQYNFGLTVISAEEINEVNISSTKIRNAILSGDISTANSFLGSNFTLTGKVVKGKQIGRKLGFPTANINIENTKKIIPHEGVYIVKIKLQNDSQHFGLLCIGNNPTIATNNNQTIEIYIFDFNQDIYGNILEVEIIHFIRKNQKFETLDLLIQQMQQDEKFAHNYLHALL